MKTKQLRWSVWSCLLAVGCMVSALMSCHDADADIDEVLAQGRRTVLVYMAAENSMQESYMPDELGQQHKDSAELVRGSKYLSEHDRSIGLQTGALV